MGQRSRYIAVHGFIPWGLLAGVIAAVVVVHSAWRDRAVGAGVSTAALALLGVVCFATWAVTIGWLVGAFLWETRESRGRVSLDRRRRRRGGWSAARGFPHVVRLDDRTATGAMSRDSEVVEVPRSAARTAALGAAPTTRAIHPLRALRGRRRARRPQCPERVRGRDGPRNRPRCGGPWWFAECQPSARPASRSPNTGTDIRGIPH